MQASARELELSDFYWDLQQDPIGLVKKKLWLHAQWYEDEDYEVVLDIAKAEDSRMTFGFLRRDVPHRLEIIKRMLAEGHEVTTHGNRHYNLDTRFGYDDILNEIGPCLDELRQIGADARGLYMGFRGALHPEAPAALVELGIDWFTNGTQSWGQDPELPELPTGLDFVKLRLPMDVQILFYEDLGADNAAKTWKEMADTATPNDAIQAHPFIYSRLSKENANAFRDFLHHAGGSVPISERDNEQGRPAIIFDASLHLGRG